MTRSAYWCLKTRAGHDVSADVADFLIGPVAAHFDLDTTAPAVTAFLWDDDSGETSSQLVNGNLFSFEGGAIEVSSVHAVKGETHAATLYMETFYNGYDVHRILPYLKGDLPTGKEGKRIKESMKVAFVGCSRPTHLLCVAIHADTIGNGGKRNTVTDDDLVELRRTWEVIDLR